MVIHESAEDYLESILVLQQRRGQGTPPYCYLGIHNAKDKTIRRERF